MSDELAKVHELQQAGEENATPAAARDVTDEEMAEEAAKVSAEEFLAFAEKVSESIEEAPAVRPIDIILEVIFFIVVVAVAYGWLMLMLLIISFVTLGYLHFEIQYINLASIIFAVCVAIGNGIRVARKYKKLGKERK